MHARYPGGWSLWEVTGPRRGHQGADPAAGLVVPKNDLSQRTDPVWRLDAPFQVMKPQRGPLQKLMPSSWTSQSSKNEAT